MAGDRTKLERKGFFPTPPPPQPNLLVGALAEDDLLRSAGGGGPARTAMKRVLTQDPALEDGCGGVGDEPWLRSTYPGEMAEDNQEPFMGMKVRRKASLQREYRRDYLGVPSNGFLIRILEKHGDRQVLSADRVVKFRNDEKGILLVTDLAIYIVDPEANALKRRVAMDAVFKLCLSELSDNFFLSLFLVNMTSLWLAPEKLRLLQY